ncbi:MAG: chemotaxis protein CheB, partial [Candidatus Hodarchaeales archaeon]
MQKINVLIVDDSGFQRMLLQNMLRDDPRIGKIRFGHNGAEGVKKTIALSPDVVILDVIMPRMDGIAALKEIMNKKPTPVLLLSALSKEQVDKALEGGMEGGAVDFLQKPTGKGEWEESQRQILLRKVIAASRANVKRLHIPDEPAEIARITPSNDLEPSTLTQKIIVFAASTGGPKALQYIFSQLPRTTPPILVVQHIAEGFTKSLAKTLNARSQIQVTEAKDGQILRPSTALVAPGGQFHMKLNNGYQTVVSLHPGPLVNFVRPAADITMTSAANIFGSGTL